MPSPPEKPRSPLAQLVNLAKAGRGIWLLLVALAGVVYLAVKYLNSHIGPAFFSLVAEAIETEAADGSTQQSLQLSDIFLTVFATFVLLTLLLLALHFILSRRLDTALNEVDSLNVKVEEIENKFEIVEAREPSGTTYKDIQQRFVEKVHNTPEVEHRSVIAIGFSYAWFWPMTIVPKILAADPDDPNICLASDWSFDFFYTSHRYLDSKGISALFGKDWSKDSKAQERSMKQWVSDAENQAFLREHSIKLKLVPHRTIPFVHGKYWHDGTRFFHLAWWDEHEDLKGLRYPKAETFHEIIEPHNQSDRAKWYRRLLDNWLQKYTQEAEPPIFDSENDYYRSEPAFYVDEDTADTPIGVAAYEKRSIEEFAYWRDGDFERIHSPLLEYLKPGLSALDVGSGLGRDSLGLANHGLSVTAVEPWAEALATSKKEMQHPEIQWVSSHLPRLVLPGDVRNNFDVILLSASWMHVPRKLRRLSMHRLAELLAIGGKLAISIRCPVDNNRGQFEATAVEARLLATEFGLKCLYDWRFDDPFEERRGTVFWDYLIFDKPAP